MLYVLESQLKEITQHLDVFSLALTRLYHLSGIFDLFKRHNICLCKLRESGNGLVLHGLVGVDIAISHLERCVALSLWQIHAPQKVGVASI